MIFLVPWNHRYFLFCVFLFVVLLFCFLFSVDSRRKGWREEMQKLMRTEDKGNLDQHKDKGYSHTDKGSDPHALWPLLLELMGMEEEEGVGTTLLPLPQTQSSTSASLQSVAVNSSSSGRGRNDGSDGGGDGDDNGGNGTRMQVDVPAHSHKDKGQGISKMTEVTSSSSSSSSLLFSSGSPLSSKRGTELALALDAMNIAQLWRMKFHMEKGSAQDQEIGLDMDEISTTSFLPPRNDVVSSFSLGFLQLLQFYRIAIECKALGNEAFKQKHTASAVVLYNKALAYLNFLVVGLHLDHHHRHLKTDIIDRRLHHFPLRSLTCGGGGGDQLKQVSIQGILIHHHPLQCIE